MTAYRIVSIRQKSSRSARLVLAFDPERASLELAPDVVAEARLAPGDQIDEERISELIARDTLIRCRERAWALLARKPRSRTELRRALLQRKFPAKTIDATLDRIEELGHLDDANFARQFVDQHAMTGKSGPRLVREQLAAKGVAREVVEKAVAPLNDREHQEANARTLLEKWNRRSKPEDLRKRQQAAAGWLMRRGFDPDIVWELVREVVGGTEE